MKQTVHAYYSGSVQGIGFRFTADSLARELGVCGWVKNLSDGRVEVVAQAEKDILDEFISRLAKIFSRYINDTETEWIGTGDNFKDFSVKF